MTDLETRAGDLLEDLHCMVEWSKEDEELVAAFVRAEQRRALEGILEWVERRGHYCASNEAHTSGEDQKLWNERLREDAVFRDELLRRLKELEDGK